GAPSPLFKRMNICPGAGSFHARRSDPRPSRFFPRPSAFLFSVWFPAVPSFRRALPSRPQTFRPIFAPRVVSALTFFAHRRQIVQSVIYDAIVVGSGISGGWAAKELTEKGLRVLVLERGRNVEHIKDYVNATKAPWEYLHRGGRTR